MSQVSNQLYEELRPLPQAQEFCPRLVNSMRRVTLVVVVVFLSASAGLALSLCNWGITPLMGGVGFGLVGLVAGIAVAILMKLPANIENYRIKTLSQIEKITANPRALEALRTLKGFFYYPFKELAQNWHHHLLYKELAIVGDSIDPNRSDAKEVWKGFLNHLEATPFQTPGKKTHLFSSTPLLNRLDRHFRQVKIESLSSWFFLLNEEDLQSIEEIGKTAFGFSYAFPAHKIKETCKRYKPSDIYMARDEQTNSILGYGWYYTEKGVMHIAEIARKPEAACLGIGRDILSAILRSAKGKPIQICLRRSHSFIQTLNKKWCFAPIKELPNYYEDDPPEDGILMQIDWQKFNQQYESFF